MKKQTAFVLWGILFIVCGVLGFIPGFSGEVSGVVQGLLTGLSLVFFLPPAWLVYTAGKTGDRDTLALVRNLSTLSLGLTLLALVLSLAFALSGQWLGDFLHVVLIVVSTPMVCSGYWVLPLFLWACLLMASLTLGKRS